MADLIRWLLRTVLAVIAPVLLILGGAALAGLGLDRELPFLIWTGLIVAACGLLWGAWLLLLADAGGDVELGFGGDSGDGGHDTPSWKVWIVVLCVAGVVAGAKAVLFP